MSRVINSTLTASLPAHLRHRRQQTLDGGLWLWASGHLVIGSTLSLALPARRTIGNGIHQVLGVRAKRLPNHGRRKTAESRYVGLHLQFIGCIID